ncbi:MAG: hypothetical protein AB1665_02305 [Candidatus Thermoplasmatota archaeon]
MKDGSKLLGFNPRRELSFNPRREIGFDPRRRLSFDSSRQLPFGRRGVVFRGYVCPVCGALVDPAALMCDECGVKFSARESAPPATQPVSPPKEGRQKGKRMQDGFACPVCATTLPVGIKNCPKCGVLFSTDKHVAPPPARMVMSCPRCGIKVAAEGDYCPRCGEAISPRARAAHVKVQKPQRMHEPPGVQRLGGPAKAVQRPVTVSLEEYLRRQREKEGGGV